MNHHGFHIRASILLLILVATWAAACIHAALNGNPAQVIGLSLWIMLWSYVIYQLLPN